MFWYLYLHTFENNLRFFKNILFHILCLKYYNYIYNISGSAISHLRSWII